MASAREVKLRIRSIKNIAQVTRALQAVSASKVQKAMQAMYSTRPYATKAWQVLTHIAAQPSREMLHPLLQEREEVKNVLVVMISGDRGLAGAYNTNIVRFVIERFGIYEKPLNYITIGRKGRDLMIRRRQPILAEFSNLPAAPTFGDVSAIGMLAVDEFLSGKMDEVYLVYTDFINMVKQIPTVKKLLPLEIETGKERVEAFVSVKETATYIYEPGQHEIRFIKQ
jgi:F-type H+-transporting ATPase subunit gamma